MNREEELQNQIEQAGTGGDGLDALAYKKVFDALKRDPDFRLPVNFADDVVARIETRQEGSREFFWLGFGIFSFAIAAVVAISLTDFKLNFGAFKFITGYPGLIIFGGLFIIALHWLDKKVIQKNLHTH